MVFWNRNLLPKKVENIETLWRHTNLVGVSFIFTIGRRYKKQPSDTLKIFKHIPLLNFENFDDFRKHIPYNCQIVCVECAKSNFAFSIPTSKTSDLFVRSRKPRIAPEILERYKAVIKIEIEKTHSSLNIAGSGTIK